MGELQTAEMGTLTPADYLSCANRKIMGLNFRLTSSDGTGVTLGGQVNFSLMFLSE